MNRTEYMEELKSSLQIFDKDITDEIINDYEEHFSMGIANGKTEEQICTELGSTAELVEELKQLVTKCAEADMRQESVECGKGRDAETLGRESKEEIIIQNRVIDNQETQSEQGYQQGSYNKQTGYQQGSFSQQGGYRQDNYNQQGGYRQDNYSQQGGYRQDSYSQGSRSWENDYQKKNTDRNEETNKSGSSFRDNMSGVGSAICRGVESLVSGACQIAKEVAGSIDKSINAANAPVEPEDIVDSAEYMGPGNAEEECDTIIVKSGCADIKVRMNNNNRVTFDYRNHGTKNQQMAYRFYHYNEGRTVYAGVTRQDTVTGFFSRIGSPMIELNITLPVNMKKVMICTQSGDILYGDINTSELQLESLSGNIQLHDITTDRMYVSVTSGDISADRISSGVIQTGSASGNLFMKQILTDKLSSHTASGKIEIDNSRIRRFDVRTVSGDIKLIRNEGDELDAESASGDVESIGNFRLCRAKNASGDLKITTETITDMNASTISGALEVYMNNNNEGYTATVSTVSGMVEMRNKGEYKNGPRKGMYTFGAGKAQLRVSTISGNMRIYS